MPEQKKSTENRERWTSDETMGHFRAAREARKQAWRSILPPEFIEQHQIARKEMLLAARSLIDDALKRMEA